MKDLLNPKKLPFEVLIMGILSWLLRRGLYTFGMDEKGLLKSNHPMEIMLWLVTILAAALIILTVRKLKGSNRFADNFRPSMAAAVGHVLAAAGIALTVLLNTAPMAGAVGKLWKLFGILSAPMLLWAAFSRVQGQRPFVLTRVIPCVFFVFHLVCHYQTWCSDPQLQNYFFGFFGALGLMLFSYYHAAFDAGCGRRRMHLAVGLLTMYLCIVNLAYTEYLYLYLGGAIWAGTSCCALEPVRRRRKKVSEQNGPA